VALGRESDADRHFSAAQAAFRLALDAGEVYTLEALARLYLAADVRLAEALELARRNLDYKRDAAARNLVLALEERSSGGAGAAGSGPGSP
jgi:hypothetical protein